MRSCCRLLVFSFFTVLLLSTGGSGQVPDTFTNLKVLPADISKGELMASMKEFTSALGVRCVHCHVGEEGQPLSTFDFASDDKESKRTARTMLRMVATINGDFIAKLEDDHANEAHGKTTVQCVTCHRGFTEPKTIEQVVREAIAEGGISQAVAQYRQLRENYYGAAGYDFRSRPLSGLAADYAQSGDYETASTLLELNAEYHPDEDGIAFLQAMVALEQADTLGAVAALERALALNPENRQVKATLQELQAPAEEK